MEAQVPQRHSWLLLIGVPALGIGLLLAFFLLLIPWAVTKVTEAGVAVLARDYGVQLELDGLALRDTAGLVVSQKFGMDLTGLRVEIPANQTKISIEQLGFDLDIASLSKGRFIVEEFLVAGLEAHLVTGQVSAPDPMAAQPPPTDAPLDLRQLAASISQAWDQLPVDVEVRRFIVRNPTISMSMVAAPEGADSAHSSGLAATQTVALNGDLVVGFDIPRAATTARLELGLSEASKLNVTQSSPSGTLTAQSQVERGVLNIEFERFGTRVGSGDGGSATDSQASKSGSSLKVSLRDAQIKLAQAMISQISQQGAASADVAARSAVTTQYSLSGVEFGVEGRDGVQCNVSVDMEAAAAFEDPQLLAISPCELVVKLVGPSMSSPERGVSLTAPEFNVTARLVHSSALKVTEKNLKGTVAFGIPALALSVEAKRLERDLGIVEAGVKALGGDRLSIDQSADIALGELSDGIASVSAAGAPEAEIHKLEQLLLQFRTMMHRTRLRAGGRIEIGRAWLFEAFAGKTPLQPAASRPSAAAWLIMGMDSQTPGPKSGVHPDAGDVSNNIFKVIEGADLQKVGLPLAEQVTRASGPWLVAALQGSLEDLVLEGKVGLRASQASSWKLMQSSMRAATAKAHMRWVVWPAGQGRSTSAAGSRQSPASGLTSVPGFFESILQTTPLKEWSARSLRTFSFEGHAGIDGLELSRQLRRESTPATLSGLAEIAKMRGDVRLNVDEEGALRMVQSGAQILARFDAKTDAASQSPSAVNSAVEPAVEPAVASSGTPSVVAQSPSQGEVSVKLDVQADVASDFSSGSLGGRALLDVPRTVSLGNSSGSSSLKGRIEIPLKIVGQRNNGVLESLVFESTLLAKNVDLTHNSNGKELRITQLRGEFPVREQVAIRPVSGHDGLVPFMLSWEPLLAENPFRRAGFKLSGPYSRTRNMIIKRIEYGSLALGPIAAALAVHQNQVLVDQIDGELFTGVLTGQCFVNFAPAALMLDFNGRVTGVDGARMLGFDGLSKSDAVLSGRAALSYAVDESTISGRVDVERIPKPLIERILSRVDPSGSDSKIGSARLALGIAAPGRLGVEMHDGLADLTLEIITKSVGSGEIRIPGLPLTKVLEGQSSELRRAIEGTLVPASSDASAGSKTNR